MLNNEFADVLDRIDLDQENHPFISEEEKRRRKEAFEYAQASIYLEGFSFSDAFTQEIHRFIKGEIDFSLLTSQLHKIANK